MNYDDVAFWSQIAGFVAFALALVWASFKWIVPAVSAAQKASNDRIQLAEKRRDAMQGSLGALRDAIEEAKRDSVTMIERVKERANHERSAIVAEAKSAGERAIANAQGELGRARAEARRKLREELASKALDIARGSAASRIDAAVNAKLIEEFIAQVSRG